MATKKSSVIKKSSTYKIVRTDRAGVFAGEVVRRRGREVEMINVRRLWYWAGAATLSQLAQEGTRKPLDCKFPQQVDRIVLLDVIEIIDVTEMARVSLQEVPAWRA